MAGPSTGQAGPRGRTAAGTSGSATLVSTFVVLLALGLALRLIIAYVLLPGSGFKSDLGSFQFWANDIAARGTVGYYANTGFLDYPPVYLLLLDFLAHVVALSETLLRGVPLLGGLIPSGNGVGDTVKLIPIVADALLAVAVRQMAQELGASKRRATIAAAVILLNPVTWFNSAIWGQADAVGAVIMLLSLRELIKDRRESSAALAVLATLTKIQLGIVGFLVVFVIVRRSAMPRSGAADPMRILTSAAAGLASAALVCLPFTGVDFAGLGQRLGSAPGLLTVGAGLIAGAGVFVLAGRILTDLAGGAAVDDETEAADNEAADAEAAKPGAMAPVRMVTALILGAASAFVFAGMAFDPIARHIVNTFGEYPYLTLNAYNPWVLAATATGESMSRTLSWVHDAPWADSSGSGPGYLIGFSTAGKTAAIALVALLAVGAIVAWNWAKAFRVGTEVEFGPGDPREPEDSSIGFANSAGVAPTTAAIAADTAVTPGLSFSDAALAVWRSEFRAVAVGCSVVAAGLGALIVAQFFGPLSAAVVGDAALLAILVGVSLWAAWRDDPRSLVVALAILAIAFFAVPTRAHERYLFPFFGVGALLLAISWRWRVAYVLLAVANIANLLAVLVQYGGIPDYSTTWATQNPGATAGSKELAGLLIGWGSFLQTAQWFDGIIWPIALAGVTVGLVLVWSLLQLRGRAVSTLADEALAAGLELELAGELTPAGEFTAAGELTPAGESALQTGLDTVAFGPSSTDDGRPVAQSGLPVADLGEQPKYVPPRVMALWRHIYRRPAMADRSAALNTEPRGRLDKLDIWLVALLIVATLSLRVYRLGEPLQMHFDEVYHARTAAEFLQDWRYDIPHSIYEWTHPDFAKYAIAGGLVLFADDKVTATSDLGVTVKDAVVQPRIVPGSAGYSSNPGTTGDAMSNPNARLGDRMYVAAIDGVRVYDLQTRALVTTFQIAGASALALDANQILYVGTTDGRIFHIDTISLDEVRLGVIAAPTDPVELAVQSGFAITKLYAGVPSLVLAVAANGDIVSVDTTANGGAIVGRRNVPGASDFAALDSRSSVLVFTPTSSATPTPTSSPLEAEASVLAKALATDPLVAKALVTDPGSVLSALEASSSSDLEKPLNLAPLNPDALAAVQKLIAQGDLPGISVSADVPQVVVAYRDGVALMDARHDTIESKVVPTDKSAISYVLRPSTVPTDHPATSIALRPGDPNGLEDSYVAAGNSIADFRISSQNGTVELSSSQPLKTMPALITQVIYDNATRLVQALGKTADGDGWTVYTIETNGDAVFSDAKLPFQPVALAADVTPQMPNTDREQLLALSADGSVATVDVGQFAFAWRIIGVLFGVLMAACLFLLARLLFRRRSVGVLVALFSIVDGMFFVQSRIAMNDTYVGGFLLLAYLLFALLWLGVWKSRLAFWVGMPVIGVILGLALASKWVALYAMASIGILILIRSALGRLVTILGLAAGTGILGWMAIAEMSTAEGTGDLPAMVILALVAAGVAWWGISWALRASTTPDRVLIAAATGVATAAILGLSVTFLPQPIEFGAPNYTYFLVMLAVTIIAAAANAYHPVAWSKEEFWFATVGPIAVGAAAALLGGLRGSHTLMLVGAGGVGLGTAAAVAFWIGGRYGFGPLARPALAGGEASGETAGESAPEPSSPAPRGWLRFGSGWGIPAVWMVGSLLVVPIAVYVASYVPWSMPWQPQTAIASTEYQAFGLPVLFCPDPDQNGNCVKGDGWPNGHTGKTLFQQTIEMYNYHNDLRSGHPASSPWWAWPMDLKPVWFENANYANATATNIYDGGNPVLWWVAIMAMGFICWQAFKRRSLGLTLITVAFFWQWISWTRIDRASFQYHFYTALPFFLLALAYFIAEIWHGPSRRTWLLARVAAALALMFPTALWLLKEPVCGLARVQLSDTYTNSACGATSGDLRVETRIFMIAAILIVALVALGVVLLRLERRQNQGYEERGWILQLIVPVIVAGILLLWVGQSGPRDLLFEVPVPSDLVVILLLPFFAVLAFIALTAVDPRRFVLGFCAIAVLAFIALYPNLSALPMPSTIVSVYQGLLPTWLYGFEFAVNQQVSTPVHLISADSLGLVVATLVVALMAAYLAWRQRVGYGPRSSASSERPDDQSDDGPSVPADSSAPVTSSSPPD